MDNEKLLNVQGLQELLNLNSPQAVIQYVKNNLAKINTDGEHAQKLGKQWLFDSVAVERITELRGTGTRLQALAIENERQAELEAQIREQAEQLAKAQRIITEHFVNVASLQNELLAGARQLTEAKTQQAEEKGKADVLQAKLEALQGRIAELEAERHTLQEKIDRLQATVLQQASYIANLQARLEAEQSKGILARLFK